MTDSFNLTTRPWIPCEFLDGRNAELSTRDVLAEAHRIRAIVDPSPLVLAVLHRHLLAVLHRSYEGPKTMAEWREIVGAAHFEAARVDRYLEMVRDRLDLLHPTHPFGQTRGLIDRGMPVTPIDELDVERSGWGQKEYLFQHRSPEYASQKTPAEAARSVLAHQAFALHGTLKGMNPSMGKTRGEPHSAGAAPLVHCAVIILSRPTLFESLTANLLLYDPLISKPVPGSVEDRPSWEQDPLPARIDGKNELDRDPLGWLDALTWLSRRVEFKAENGAILGFTHAAGRTYKGETGFVDPQVTYVLSRQGGYQPIRIKTDRAFWRDSNALFETQRDQSSQFSRPHAIGLVAPGEGPAPFGEGAAYTLDILGQDAESGIKVDIHCVRHESLTVKGRLFGNPDTREAVEHVLHLAEEAVEHLRASLYTFARHVLPRSDSENKEQREERRALVKSLGAEPAVWSTLGMEFEAFLQRFDYDDDGARRGFEEGVRRAIRKSFDNSISRATSDARTIKAQALAEMQLQRALAALSGTETAATAEP